MRYSQVVQGSFVRRLNRFVAEADIGGRMETVHVKNTGRLKELLVPGAKIYLDVSGSDERKYRYSLIAAERDGILVNIDSQAPNAVVYEAVTEGKVKEIGRPRILKREVVHGQSRFDLYFEGDGHKGYMEIKGVTLWRDGVAMFPDAPTSRGRKHVQELIAAARAGYRSVVLFLLQFKGVRRFVPHAEMDPAFAGALKEAAAAGVEVLAYDSEVSPSGIRLGAPIRVDI